MHGLQRTAGLVGCTCNLRIQSVDCGAQAFRNHFCVVPQRRLGVGMPQMALHVLHRCMALEVC